MLQQMNVRRQALGANPKLADLLSLLGLGIFSLSLIFFAHTERPVLDEGLYLYKGWLFVSGRYAPYQDYGPWMNQMPLSFLIPGTAQVLFGPGLRTGRYFAIFLGLLMLVGLWLTARRLGGKWTAAGVVWIFALNFAVTKYYSIAISEGLVASFIAWILFFSLGDDRPLWQIILAAALSAVLVLIRVNMAPILFLLLLYLWWEHGWRKARWSALAAALTFAGLHALFWPKILQNWAVWLPADLTAFLNDFRPPGPKPDRSVRAPLARLDSLFYAVRFHFLAIAGSLGTWLLWPARNQWKNQSNFRIAIFLSAAFGILFLLHSWASLGNSYCVSCLPAYTAFFQILGVLLVVVSWQSWGRNISRINQIVAVLLILILCSGMAYSLVESVDVRPIEVFSNVFVHSQTIREASGDLKNGISQFFAKIFVLRTEKDAVALAKRASLALYGLITGILILLVAGILRWSRKGAPKDASSYGRIALNTFLLFGILLIPTKFMAGYNAFECRKDQISNFEGIGEVLAERIPPGSQIYWMGYSPALLLYMPDVKIYPPQLNAYNSTNNSSDLDAVFRYGLWNHDLAELWIEEASYAIITQLSYTNDAWMIKEYIKSGIYSEIPVARSIDTCEETDQLVIRLFERK